MFPRLRGAIHKMFHPAEGAGAGRLGDFTMSSRAIWISGLGIGIGVVSGSASCESIYPSGRAGGLGEVTETPNT